MARKRKFKLIKRKLKLNTFLKKKEIKQKASRQMKLQKAMKYIRNLSSHQLTEGEILLLGRGLKFTPSTKWSVHQALNDFKLFEKKLRWKYLLHINDCDNETKPPFSVISKRTPPMANAIIENYIEATKKDLSDILDLKLIHNLSKEETQAIKALKSQPDIMICKADKGSSVILWDKQDYIREGMKQLNGIHYEKVDIPCTSAICYEIRKVLRTMLNENNIDDLTAKYLLEDRKIKLPHLYLLPKIHKIATTLSLYDNIEGIGQDKVQIPGRPIVSQCSGPFDRVSRYLDYFLIPIVKNEPWYVRDTKQMVNILENLQLPDDVILSNYDITSMYSNMDFRSVLKAVEKAYDNSSITYGIQKPTTINFMKLLKLSLENNIFEFEGMFFRQIIGVAMGSAHSPECSDLTMFELLKEIEKKFKFMDKVILHRKYRDDGIILFSGSKDELHEFYRIANNEHPLLKFTYEISNEKITFLDLNISKGPKFKEMKKLDMDTHFKATDTFQYLDVNSNHPQHCFSAIIKGEMLRNLRNTNNKNIFLDNMSKFRHRLIDRGYNTEMVDKTMAVIKFEHRDDALKNKPPTQNPTTPLCFVTKYNKSAPNLSLLIKQHWNIMEESWVSKEIFPNKPIISYKRSRNLGELLK